MHLEKFINCLNVFLVDRNQNWTQYLRCKKKCSKWWGGWQNAMMIQKELSYEFSLKKRLLKCSNLSLVAFKRERFWPSTAFLSSWYRKWTLGVLLPVLLLMGPISMKSKSHREWYQRVASLNILKDGITWEHNK